MRQAANSSIQYTANIFAVEREDKSFNEKYVTRLIVS